jgi:hypothetical protein
MWSLRRDEPRGKNASKLYAQPAEVADKLVKEMEDDKVTRGSHVSVRNHYMVYLCREDHERWRRQEELLVSKLETHLTRHMRQKGFEAPGAIAVELATDPELKLGHFGIYAEREMRSGVVRKGKSASAAAGAGEAGSLAAAAAAAGHGATGAGVAVAEAAAARGPAAGEGQAGLDADLDQVVWPTGDEDELPDLPSALPEGQEGAGPEIQPDLSSSKPVSGLTLGTTQVISMQEAADLGLAKQVIVLRADDQEFEFTKGHVVVGRSRDVDFRIENADVSRRHAAFFWSDGNIMVKDLGSTNGTMVNGYPVDSTIVHPGDVVVIGDCFITAEAR